MSEKRDAYVENLKVKLDEWNLEIDDLQRKTAAAKETFKADYERHLEELKAKRNEASSKLEALKSSGEDAWADLKAGVDSAWGTMAESILAAKARFR